MRNWIDRGGAGPLDYMRNFFQRRERFLSDFSDLKSILVLTERYGTPVEPASIPSAIPSGRIARYAWGKDYHLGLRAKLKKLAAFIRQIGGDGTRTKMTVDTSPLHERSAAEAAGLGFIGKNTCLIHPKDGSLFFLATVLTNLALAADEPLRWDCGSCTLCIQACPTGALQPYQLDCNRCISSLTVEYHGSIDPELRPRMGDWILGCDICQEVCPYNHQAVPLAVGQGRIPLPNLIQSRNDLSFQALYAGTALKRPGRASMARNACIAAANSHSSGMISALQEAAYRSDPSEVVQETASWALQRLKKETAP